jgi:death on curing protein
LAHGIAETQPFVDGNKRTALAVMLTFLGVNGFAVVASQRSLASWMIRLSDDLDSDGLADLIRDSLRAAEIQLHADD